MIKVLLIVLSFSFVVSSQNLDTLMRSGAQQVRQLKMMPLITLTPPEKLFAARDTVPSVPQPSSHGLNILYQNQHAEMDKRVRDLEINITKVSVILENMQRVNQKHTDKFDSVMQFLGVIITAMAGIVTALIGVFVKGRKK